MSVQAEYSDRMMFVMACWDAFVAKRGPSAQACSPAEWGIMANWYDAGWPLRIVLRGIKDCAGQMSARSTVGYVTPAVQEAVRQWYKGQVS